MSHNYGVTAAKAFPMHALRKSTALLWGIFFLAGCGPQGYVQRVIHPPLDLSGRDAKNAAQQAAASGPRTRQGLPMQCRLDVRVKDTFCISCDEGGLDIERCYMFRGLFNDAKNCVYSAEHIKCLYASPPFALKIPIKGSLEKSLQENTRTWQETLRTIAKPQLSPDLQNALEEGLKQTGDLVQILVKARKDSHWIEQTFPQLAPPLKKAIGELQLQKEAGQLKLLQILQVSRMMLEASGTPTSLLPYWEALSIEGLEEHGE
jgi:hypothetical protein